MTPHHFDRLTTLGECACHDLVYLPRSISSLSYADALRQVERRGSVGPLAGCQIALGDIPTSRDDSDSEPYPGHAKRHLGRRVLRKALWYWVGLIPLGFLAPGPCLSAQSSGSRPDLLARRLDERGGPVGNNDLDIPKTYFIGVGIDDYDDSAGWRTLKGAVNDLDGMVSVLGESYHVTVFDTLRNERATKDAIWDLIVRFMDEAGEVDLLEGTGRPNAIFYFAGHGERLLTEEGEEQVFLIAHDGESAPANKKKSIANSPAKGFLYGWLSLEEYIFKEFKGSTFNQVIVIIDACYAGSQSNVAALDMGSEAGAHRVATREIITATLPRQKAEERVVTIVDTVQNSKGVATVDTVQIWEGLFTGRLKEQLQKAATSSDSVISSGEIAKRVSVAMGALPQTGTADTERQRPILGKFRPSGQNYGRFGFWLRSNVDKSAKRLFGDRLLKAFEHADSVVRRETDKYGGCDNDPYQAVVMPDKHGTLRVDVEGVEVNDEQGIMKWFIDFKCAEEVKDLPNYDEERRDESLRMRLLDNEMWDIIDVRYKARRS